MAVKQLPLDTIDDNPYNPRRYYAPAKVKEMANSLCEVGMRQGVEGRQVDGRVQLAYGHMRLRAYRHNLKQQLPGSWATMPVDVKELSDRDMFDFALEENLRRTDVKPIEVARCIQGFSGVFPEVTEKAIGEKHGMTEANVSNMLRVLRLPEKFLDKIDEGIISFTQGRELLTLEGIPGAEEIMSSALAGINTTGTKQYSKPNTVEGLQQSIAGVIRDKFPPLDKEWAGYRWNLLFDTREAGCLKCDKCTVTHATKSQVAHYCTDEECWKKKTDEHKAKAAAAAKAKMEAEVLERAAKDVALRTPAPGISQEKLGPALPNYSLEKRGTSWIALDGQGLVIAIDYDKKAAEDKAKASFEPVVTNSDPYPDKYLLNHTYRIIGKPEVEESRKYIIPDVTAQDLATALKSLELKPEDVKSVKVWKSSGKLGTGGSVSTGWSKCTEGVVKHAELPTQAPTEVKTAMPIVATAQETTQGTSTENIESKTQDIPKDIPEDMLQKAREAAGTRAEVLDLDDICAGSQYSRYMKQGYALLSDELKHVDDPEECLERCTHGFHYAFDSKYPDDKEIFVCSDLKCLTQKKGDLTRKKNAAGQALKNAERKAIQEAVEGARNHPRGLMLLVLYAQIKGSHVSNYSYGGIKPPEKWLWDKVSAGTKENERKLELLMKKLDKLDEAELLKLLVEMMFYYLADHGDTGSYQVKTELPLGLMGVDIQKEEAAAGSA